MRSVKRGLAVLLVSLFAVPLVVGWIGQVGVDAAQNPVRMRFGLIFGPQVPIVKCGALPLAQDPRLRELGFDILVVHSAQLGSEVDMAQQISAGELEMGATTASILAAWLDALSVFETYYLYDDVDHVYEVHSSPLGQALYDELRAISNIRVIGKGWLYGERHIFGNRPIRQPEDLRGLKLRVPETQVSIAGARSLGASPTPTAYAELFLALQQGIVDAAEAPASVAYAESFHEAVSYFNLTRHLISVPPITVNERFWQRLTPEQQAALDQAVREAADRVRACVEADDQQALAAWREAGSPIIVEDIDYAALRAQARDYFSRGFPWSDVYTRLIR